MSSADLLAELFLLIGNARLVVAATAPSETVQYAQVATPFVAMAAVAATVWGLSRAGKQQNAALAASQRNHDEALSAADDARYREATREAVAATIAAFHSQIEALRALVVWMPAYNDIVGQVIMGPTPPEGANKVVEAYRPFYEAARSAESESRVRMALSQMYFARGSEIGDATVRAYHAILDARQGVIAVTHVDELTEMNIRLDKAREALQGLAATVGAAYRPDRQETALPPWWFGV